MSKSHGDSTIGLSTNFAAPFVSHYFSLPFNNFSTILNTESSFLNVLLNGLPKLSWKRYLVTIAPIEPENHSNFLLLFVLFYFSYFYMLLSHKEGLKDFALAGLAALYRGLAPTIIAYLFYFFFKVATPDGA